MFGDYSTFCKSHSSRIRPNWFESSMRASHVSYEVPICRLQSPDFYEKDFNINFNDDQSGSVMVLLGDTSESQCGGGSVADKLATEAIRKEL